MPQTVLSNEITKPKKVSQTKSSFWKNKNDICEDAIFRSTYDNSTPDNIASQREHLTFIPVSS